MKFCIIFFIFFALYGVCNGFRRQSAAVRGQLFCGNEPAADVEVKLYDKDDGNIFFFFNFIWIQSLCQK